LFVCLFVCLARLASELLVLQPGSKHMRKDLDGVDMRVYDEWQLMMRH